VTNADQHIAETASKLIKKFQKIIWADYKNQNPIQNAYYAIANNQNIDIDNKYLIEGKNSDLIKYAHSKHLLVNTWTVNNTTDLNKLLQFGVDQITGNVIF
jgi:glycerophosphoryl diester phosphodiesterase